MGRAGAVRVPGQGLGRDAEVEELKSPLSAGSGGYIAGWTSACLF